MKKAIAMADNCIDVYYRMDRYYLTGNSIDFALNYKAQGGDVTEMTVLGNDVFADALVERLKQRDIPLRVLKRIDRPTGMAKMDLVDGDKKHLEFHGNAMEEIELSAEDMEFVKGFDIVYAERWAKAERYIAALRQPGQIWVYDFSKRLEQPSNDALLPYLDYAFFSYDRDDVLKRIDRPTGMAKMDLVDGDKKHLEFHGNAMEEIELSAEDMEFVKGFDIVYAERWAKAERYIAALRQPGQIWVYDFSKRLEQPSNDALLPYLDYAFFSYDRDDDYIREFMRRTKAKGAGCVIAMLGEHGSLAYDGQRFYHQAAENVPVVNTVGAGDSYIAAFTYGVSLGESIPQCMARGKALATRIVQQFDPYLQEKEQ